MFPPHGYRGDAQEPFTDARPLHHPKQPMPPNLPSHSQHSAPPGLPPYPQHPNMTSPPRDQHAVRAASPPRPYCRFSDRNGRPTMPCAEPEIQPVAVVMWYPVKSSHWTLWKEVPGTWIPDPPALTTSFNAPPAGARLLVAPSFAVPSPDDAPFVAPLVAPQY